MPKINQLYVPKRYGNYADTCLMLGLAQLAKIVFKVIGVNKQKITLIDDGFQYRLVFKQAVETEAINDSFPYTDLFPLVKGAKTTINESIPEEEVKIFNTVKETEHRKRYRDFIYPGGKRQELGDDSPDPPDPRTQNGVILTSMRHDRNHNGLWEGAWTFREDFGVLVAYIFEAFSEESNSRKSPSERVTDLFKKRTQKKLSSSESAVKIFMPTSVQGVNRIKADSNKTDPQKADWLELWLIAGGLFHFGLSERVKDDWRVVVLNPQDISLDDYRTVLDNLRKFNPPGGSYGIARFDAELVIKFYQELLNYHYHPIVSRRRDGQNSEYNKEKPVNGFFGSHFGSKGQVYGVKDLFSLGLPNWIQPTNSQEVINYFKVLKEHLSVIQSLTDKETEILAAYRDFITGSDLALFFPFQILYAEFAVKRLADPKARDPRLFSIRGLDLMTGNFVSQKDQDFSINEIIKDPGFLRIARAINSSTVYAGKISTKNGQVELDWQRTYGLAQRLSNNSGSKKDFIIELTTFLTSYQNENLRISEQLQKEGKTLKRVWPTKEDLDRVIELINNPNFGCSLVANLLIAYGYAKWTKPLSEEGQEPSLENNNETDKTLDQDFQQGE